MKALLPLMNWLLALTLAFAAGCACAGDNTLDQAPGERRMALIIGNGAYKFSPLKNPLNDARAMGTALQALGFEVVVKENAGLQSMLDAMREFTLKAKDSPVRLFYYAGHGVQVKGKNYLIPVDAEIASEDDVPPKSADVSEFLERLGQIRNGLNIMILDACRNNPFANVTMAGPDGRVVRFRGSVRAGLAQVDAPQGTLVAFSTAPGAIALDGGNFHNSLYTKHLLSNIGIAGLPVEQMFKRVRIAVSTETQRLQVPWESSSLMGDFCFKSHADGKCVAGGASLLDPRAGPQ
jgi:uncharacterized caspase-like protein